MEHRKEKCKREKKRNRAERRRNRKRNWVEKEGREIERGYLREFYYFVWPSV
jgi:hypothetical protein